MSDYIGMPLEQFITLLGIGLGVAGAMISFAIKNTRDLTEARGCITRIEQKQEAIEKRLDTHIAIAREADKELQEAKLDIRELQSRAVRQP